MEDKGVQRDRGLGLGRESPGDLLLECRPQMVSLSLSEALPCLQGTREGQGGGGVRVWIEGRGPWQSGQEEAERDNRPALFLPAPHLDAWGSLHSSGLRHAGIPLGPRCIPGHPVGHAQGSRTQLGPGSWLSRHFSQHCQASPSWLVVPSSSQEATCWETTPGAWWGALWNGVALLSLPIALGIRTWQPFLRSGPNRSGRAGRCRTPRRAGPGP